MYKNILLILIGIIILFVGIGWWSYSQLIDSKQLNQTQNSQTLSTEESEIVDSENSSDQVSSPILEYSPEIIDQTKNTQRILFFFANWCPTCKAAEADFRANIQALPDDVRIIKVNYNDTQTDQDEKALAQKYGITYQHTFVLVDEDMNLLQIWNGGETEELLQKISQR